MLKNKSQEKFFFDNGYLKFRFLSTAKIEKLRSIYNQYAALHQVQNGGMFFHATQDTLTYSNAKAVDEALLELMLPEIETFFEDYQLLIGSFLVKEPGEYTYLQPHQDWNFTDESRYYSFNIWVPLQPIDQATGSLLFLPGSHKIVPTIRPNFMYEWAFQDAQAVVEKNFTEVTVEAGECVLINHAVIHASKPNISQQPRVASVIGMIPKKASIVHYFSDNGKDLEVYRLLREDLYDIKQGVRPPQEKLVCKASYIFPKAEAATVEKWIADKKNEQGTKKPLFKSAAYDTAMEESGYCIINGLSPQAVDSLKLLHLESMKLTEEGLHANHNRLSPEVNEQICTSIETVVKSFLDRHFANYRVYVAHFMVKSKDTIHEMPLHQDWNIVDELNYNSYQVWIPLQMVEPVNGGLFVLRGSHKLFGNYRSGSLGLPRVPSDSDTNALVETITTPPGTAVVYNNGLFHASFPNSTAQARVSVIVNIVQQDAPTYFFHKSATPDTIECYDMDGKTLLQHLPSLERGIVPPSMKLAKELEQKPLFSNGVLDATALTAATLRQRKEKPYAHIKPLLGIVKHQALEDMLSADGYLQLQFLNNEEVARLKKVYQEISKEDASREERYTTQEAEDAVVRRQVYEEIKNCLQHRLDELFTCYKIPILQFFVKMPHTAGGIDFHTDSTLLMNPHLEPHYGIWIPLTDVDASNGALVVVPGSHLNNNHISATSIPWSHYGSMESWKHKAKMLPMKAGGLVIFDNRLIHTSSFNESAMTRVAVAGRVTHEDSVYYSFFKENGTIKVFQEADDIYQLPGWNSGHQPSATGQEVGCITYKA